MEKQKRWQKYLILGVILLTIYNILPTVFFYTKPLKSPIDARRAELVSTGIIKRVNGLEKEAEKWLTSFCKLLKLNPQTIAFEPNDPAAIAVTFKNETDAEIFRRYLPRAGALIPFVPQQLTLYDNQKVASKTVMVQRQIPLHLDEGKRSQYFEFAHKFDSSGSPTALYRALTYDRLLQLALALGGNSETGQLMQAAGRAGPDEQGAQLMLKVAQNLLSFVSTFGENSPQARRYFASYTQVDEGKETVVSDFLRMLTQVKDQIKLQRIELQGESQTLQASGSFLDGIKQQKLAALLSQEKTLSSSEQLIKRQSAAFGQGRSPLHFAQIGTLLEQSAHVAAEKGSKQQVVDLEGRHPFIQNLVIDFGTQTFSLNLYPDLTALQRELEKAGKIAQREQVDGAIYNEIAEACRLAKESVSPISTGFQISLSTLQDSNGILALRLPLLAKAQVEELKKVIREYWHPKHPDLVADSFPIFDYETYEALPSTEKNLGLVIYAPGFSKQVPQEDLRMSSIYVIAKGMDKIIQRLGTESSKETEQFAKDFNELKLLLQKKGFAGYPGSLLSYGKTYAGDFIFENEDYFQTLLKATREAFTVYGTRRYATLELGDVHQRILAQNKIDDSIHEDLLKWRDEYHSAQLSLGGSSLYDVPKPTSSPLWSNLALSFVKYFRGDERKILHWGLDLSGGKTVQIQLRDQNGKPAVAEEQIRQGINQLYTRVNKMGISEVSIRQEGDLISLDFPGSQNLSAGELIKASTMYFHIVNEKFGPKNPTLAAAADQFLQTIWNEAVVTGHKNAEEINQIAWKHLHGSSLDPEVVAPRSEATRLLYESGLRLPSPLESSSSALFNDALCKIAVIRGDSFTQWYGQSHPLLIVFNNFAVEGANLKNVHAGYDPSKGNFLVFEIKGKETLPSGEKINPRDDLHAWTSQFAKDQITGTDYAHFSRGDGWRMAVILNGSVITAPALSYPISDGGTIEGSFTQREVSLLEADLKAGSLSFTPRILSEKNVSPELGSTEKTLGIIATVIALVLAIASMVSYYRFGGVVASVAVLFNLFIMWAALQNLGATLTLASIAGIILTLGMAVDANVLVFERVREEFAISGRIASAIHAGYRKAFSAIFDSNITTLIAALILLQFNSGPIKGLAITLTIGILSSMFTALFMTRYFFAGWVQNPQHKELKMASLIKIEKFDFLKWSKLAFVITAVVIAIGALCFIWERHSILGMDFTGGYSLTLEVQGQNPSRASLEKALVSSGVTAQEIQVRQLTPNSHFRLFLSKGLEQSGRPFHSLPAEYDLKDPTYSYEKNPRLTWVVGSLNREGIALTPDSLKHLEQNWTSVSGQLSDTMRSSAFIGLSIALLAILIYITIRFEFKYAAAATLCLAHDLLLTLSFIGLLHFLHVPVQIDLNAIAALVTIIGYSLNDTIIIFDRIREDLRVMRKASFKEVVNHALNVTLSRTTLTSGTTLLVLLPLVFLGGSTLFGFALVMSIGVVLGTLSSLFIAAPLLYYFHQRALGKEIYQTS